jgi:hypothetical protein
VAWLKTDEDGREIAISDYDLERQAFLTQELWKGAEPLYRKEPEKQERSDFERDMI